MQAIVKILDGKAADLERRFGAQPVAGAFLVQAIAVAVLLAGDAAVCAGLYRLARDLHDEARAPLPGASQAPAGDHEHPELQLELERIEHGLRRDYDCRTIATALTTVAIDRTVAARGEIYAAAQLVLVADRMRRASNWN